MQLLKKAYGQLQVNSILCLEQGFLTAVTDDQAHGKLDAQGHVKYKDLEVECLFFHGKKGGSRWVLFTTPVGTQVHNVRSTHMTSALSKLHSTCRLAAMGKESDLAGKKKMPAVLDLR